MTNPEKDVMHDALKWRAIMDADEVTGVDRAAFTAWLQASPAHRHAFDKARDFWNGLAGLKDAPIDHLRVNETETKASSRLARFPVRQGRLAVAACITAVVCFFLLPEVFRHAEVAPRYLATATGEIRTEQLDDGSRITLGAQSSMSILMTQERRAVEVLSGSAFFEVSKEDRPFEVIGGRLRIEVTGTQFAVYRSASEAQVSVAEGSVAVSDTDNATSARALQRGQRLVAGARAGLGATRRISPEKVGAWRRSRLVYEEESLGKLIDDLNRYRDKPIEFSESGIAAKTITATFDTAELDMILPALAELYALEVIETPATTVLRQLR